MKSLICAAAVSMVDAKITWGQKCLKRGVDYQTQQVDLTKYLGRWYEIQRDTQSPFEWGSSCDTADYSLFDAQNTIINVDNRSKFNWSFGQYITAHGKGKCSADGYCTVSF
jgi:lipocalin